MIPRKMLFSFLLYFVGTVVVTAYPDPGPIKRVGKQQEEFTLPVAKIFEVDQNNRVLRQWTKINEKSETVLEGVDKIRLECTSDDHPVQWLYLGHGVSLIIIIT